MRPVSRWLGIAVLTAVVLMMVGSVVAPIGADAAPRNRVPIVAEGTLKTNTGSPIAGAKVIAFAVDKSNPDEENWYPATQPHPGQ